MANFGKSRKPAPFQRPSIEIGAVEREWRTVDISEISVNDVIAGGFGVVKKIETLTDPYQFKIEAGEGTYLFHSHEKVFAFTNKESKNA